MREMWLRKSARQGAAWDNRASHLDIIGFEIDGSQYQSGMKWVSGIYNGGSHNGIHDNHIHHIGTDVPCEPKGGAGVEEARLSFPIELATGAVLGRYHELDAALEQIADWLNPDGQVRIIFRTIYEGPGSVNGALEPLRMARKLDRYRDTARMVLEPWIVEAALARLGRRRLTVEEQERVVDATRTPSKVRWPDWWEVRRK